MRLWKFLTVTAALVMMSVSAFTSTQLPGGESQSEAAKEVAGPTEALKVNLPAPESNAHRNYLGLTEEAKTFTLAELDSRYLVLQVFSAYCHKCQAEAPDVNGVFESLAKENFGRLRFVALGVKNSVFEVNLFRDRYQTTYPLVADEDMEASSALGVRLTPTYFIVDTAATPAKVIYMLEGGFDSPQQFVETVLEICKP